MTGAMVVSSVGLTVASFTGKAGADASTVHAYAAYAGSRSLVLVGALVWCAWRRAWLPVSVLLGLNGLVQVLDTAIGAAQHDVAKTAGPACFAVLLLASSWWLHMTNQRAADRRGSIGCETIGV